MAFKELIVLIVSFSITFFSIPFIRLLAFKKGIIDIPNGILKVHSLPTPYLGGLAFYCGFMPFFVLFSIYDFHFYLSFFGLTFLLLLGLIDDIYNIAPFQKFVGQLVAAFFFIQADFCFKAETLVQFFPRLSIYFSDWSLHFFALFISLIWITTIINAFNLIDIMDGLLATISSCVVISWLIVHLTITGSATYTLFYIAFLGSMVAFFWYNKPRAAIFIGDAGSLFVGGFLSIIPFMSYRWQDSQDVFSLFLPFFIFAIPLFEVFFLIIIRTLKRIPFYHGSPHHFISYLKKQGLTTKKILSLILLLSFCFSGLGIIVAFFYKIKSMLLFALIGIFVAWILIIFKKSLFPY